MLVREIYAQGSADLKFAEIETPGLDASILLAHVLKTNRTALIAAGMDFVSKKDCIEFCKLIERRAGGECVAYIIGKKEFRGLEFTVNKSVLVPRPDTETLVEAALESIRRYFHHEGAQSSTKEDSNYSPCAPANRRFDSPLRLKRILDLCTGSGAVAISLKHEMPELDVYATDICPKALKTAKLNAEKLIGKNKIQFFHGDLFDALPSSPSSSSASLPNLRFEVCENSSPNIFSLIVSNPPYIKSSEIQTLSAEVQNEPRLALDGGHSGLDIIGRIIENAPKYLEQNGYLLLEADPCQMEDIKSMLAKNGFNGVQLYKDLSGSNRVIGGRYEK